MNFLIGYCWLLLCRIPRALGEGYRVRARAWEEETGTKPKLIALIAVGAVVWSFAVIQFVWWVADLIRYVA